jgi:hypothetical protein
MFLRASIEDARKDIDRKRQMIVAAASAPVQGLRGATGPSKMLTAGANAVASASGSLGSPGRGAATDASGSAPTAGGAALFSALSKDEREGVLASLLAQEAVLSALQVRSIDRVRCAIVTRGRSACGIWCSVVVSSRLCSPTIALYRACSASPFRIHLYGQQLQTPALRRLFGVTVGLQEYWMVTAREAVTIVLGTPRMPSPCSAERTRDRLRPVVGAAA